MARLRTLAVSVASKKVGHVFLIGDNLVDWGITRKASENPELAVAHLQKLLEWFEPNLIVTEDISINSSKGNKSRNITSALASKAAALRCIHQQAIHLQKYRNKYDEAIALAEQYSDLEGWIPRKPKIWQEEPNSTIIFEALSIALIALGHDQNACE